MRNSGDKVYSGICMGSGWGAIDGTHVNSQSSKIQQILGPSAIVQYGRISIEQRGSAATYYCTTQKRQLANGNVMSRDSRPQSHASF